MPVESMSMRALIGIVHALETPGNCSDRSISAISLSIVMPGRHSLSGLRLITVSNLAGCITGSSDGFSPFRIVFPDPLA